MTKDTDKAPENRTDKRKGSREEEKTGDELLTPLVFSKTHNNNYFE